MWNYGNYLCIRYAIFLDQSSLKHQEDLGYISASTWPTSNPPLNKGEYHNYLCIRKTIFADFSVAKSGVRIIYKKYIINFVPVKCLNIFRMRWLKVSYIYSPNWMCFMQLQINIYWNVCLFIIFFFLMWAYFCCKFLAFLCEQVYVFALNTV